jgi:hypothetical protein
MTTSLSECDGSSFEEDQALQRPLPVPLQVHVPHSNDYMQSFPSKGGGHHVINGRAMMSSARKGLLAEPGQLTLSYSAEFEHFAAFLDPAALSGALTALVGRRKRSAWNLTFRTTKLCPRPVFCVA